MDFLDITDFKDLSDFLNIKPNVLGYMLMKLPRNELYTTFSIPKKHGGDRTISAPNIQMRKIQNRIKLELEKHYKPSNYAHGFIKGRSIVTNAKLHIKKNWVVNIDLLDFFPSITAKRIYGLLKTKPFSFSSKIASLLSNILTFNDCVPQGATASPILTNMICFKLDRELAKYCMRKNITYSRYVDDITFSSTSRAKLEYVYNETSNTLNEAIISIISKNGFLINNTKIRNNFYFNHQEVTGIKTNFALNIKKFQKYKIRSMLHAWQKFGLDNAVRDYMKKNNIEGEISDYRKTFTDELIGLIAYAKMVLGKDNTFYAKVAHDFNSLYKKNQFYVKYSINEYAENAIFELVAVDSKKLPISSGIAFYANGMFFTCLHNVYDYNGFQLLKDLGSTKARIVYISRFLKNSLLINKIFDNESMLDLNDAEIKFLSIEMDLLVFTLSSFYSPYQFKISSTNIDRRLKYTFLSLNSSSHDVIEKECKLASKKRIGDYDGYPLDIEIYNGMSGSPLVTSDNNHVQCYVVFGTSGDSEDDETYKNGVYDLFGIMDDLV